MPQKFLTNIDLDGNRVRNAAPPAQPADLATKGYVDDAVGGTGYGYAVIERTDETPNSPSTGDRYIVGPAPTGAFSGHAHAIAEWDGSAWQFTSPELGVMLFSQGDGLFYAYAGALWEARSAAEALQAGAGLTKTGLVLTADMRKSTHNVGNEQDTSFECVHTRATRDVVVSIRSAIAPFPVVQAAITHKPTETGTIVVSFDKPPQQDEFTVTIIG